MNLQDYVDEIKFELTGGVLELEIPDESIAMIVNHSMKELQRYIDSTKLITIPYTPCIDLTGFKCSAIVNVYRTEGNTGNATGIDGSQVDPMYAQRWMAFSSGGTMYNLQSYLLNYMSYNTLLQMRNTTSTDLAFKEDKTDKKLYINVGYDIPKEITLEFVPIYEDVSEITSDYWIDILHRMSLARTKVALGRIRTRFKQTNPLWEQDGETILAEGTEELNTLRETLRTNSTLCYPVD